MYEGQRQRQRQRQRNAIGVGRFVYIHPPTPARNPPSARFASLALGGASRRASPFGLAGCCPLRWGGLVTWFGLFTSDPPTPTA